MDPPPVDANEYTGIADCYEIPDCGVGQYRPIFSDFETTPMEGEGYEGQGVLVACQDEPVCPDAEDGSLMYRPEGAENNPDFGYPDCVAVPPCTELDSDSPNFGNEADFTTGTGFYYRPTFGNVNSATNLIDCLACD